ncbi:MAG: DUF1761 domain-containing protein [Saprospiraceae bacterium]|nr:DUF1761 domain-containing protein [Saprospiraceae bacterium]
MEPHHINHWAILTCALLNLLLGAIWYSPLLFYPSWMKANQFTESDLATMNQGKTYGITLLLSLAICYTFVNLLSPYGTDFTTGIITGFRAGLGLAGCIFTVIALFEQRTWNYILINGGYIVVYLTLVGGILSIWH